MMLNLKSNPTLRGLPPANLSLITRANTKDLSGALYLNPVPRKAMWHQTFEFPDDGSLSALHVKDHNVLLPTSSIGDCIVLPSTQRYPIQHKVVDIDSQQGIDGNYHEIIFALEVVLIELIASQPSLARDTKEPIKLNTLILVVTPQVDNNSHNKQYPELEVETKAHKCLMDVDDIK
ncbi:hypothetical protein Tco_0668168 [Tanacetum coccineum]|uniref:Uncharacterized protein n=1 Tax=Tanacetum coccineum TaxID=301880 RepID=A0ABQ5BNB0_9ASTR